MLFRVPRALVIAALVVAADGVARAEPVDLRLDTEPAAWVLRGYSIHLASTLPFAPRVVVGGTLYGFQVPDQLVELGGDNRAEDWDVRLRVGYGVFADYYLGDRAGWLVGGQLGFQQYRARGPATDAIFTDVIVLARGGYEWHPRGVGFYLMPWLGAAYTTTISGDPGAYHVFPVLPYAACDLGWRF
jgi:hypothetical protein